LTATQPTVAMEPVGATEPCPHCGTALALDQRYCLECGAPRTYLSGMLLEQLRSPSAPGTPTQPSQPPPLGGVAALGPPALPPSSSSSTWQRGNVLTLIAGIGVLLLAMGVGVLIGRSGGSSSATPAPQVISVGGGTGAAGASTTPTTPEATSTGKSGSGSSRQGGKGSGGSSSGVGSSPSKPAPPTVLKNLRTGGGQSYEQKSKNLPDVVSTG
jgi:hypothetical protein